MNATDRHKRRAARHASIVQEARHHFRARHGKDAPPGACLYWAQAIITVAQRHGIRLVLQAGTAMFRRLPPHLDDGKPTTSTHFSYVWTPTTPTPTAHLPEMHVWAGDPERQHIVDLSTFALTTMCQNILGELWLEAPPPAFIWCTPAHLPDGWLYQPNREATLFAASLLAPIEATTL